MKAYGPVPSRRLGRSLGINNIPPKICTYSCIYCQLGRTIDIRTERTNFYSPEDLAKEVEEKLEQAEIQEENIDYLSFVPDGEPTLDQQLGEEIDLLSTTGVKVAVISNSSLITDPKVREDLGKADGVSLKVDAVNEEVWRNLNRPDKSFNLVKILRGMERFSDQFNGVLATETMLIDGVNDGLSETGDIANFLEGIDPNEAYISIPTRPPAEDWATAACEEKITQAYQKFSKNLRNVEYLLGYEGNEFSSTGDLEEDLLSIASVHPIREEGVEKLLEETGSSRQLVDKLIEEGKLIETEFENSVFYTRKLPNS